MSDQYQMVKKMITTRCLIVNMSKNIALHQPSFLQIHCYFPGAID